MSSDDSKLKRQGTPRRGTSPRPVGGALLSAGLALAATLALAGPAAAQNNVFVNQQLLNSLGAGPVPFGQTFPGQALPGQGFVAVPGGLQFPPMQPPRSTLTQPQAFGQPFAQQPFGQGFGVPQTQPGLPFYSNVQVYSATPRPPVTTFDPTYQAQARAPQFGRAPMQPVAPSVAARSGEPQSQAFQPRGQARPEAAATAPVPTPRAVPQPRPQPSPPPRTERTVPPPLPSAALAQREAQDGNAQATTAPTQEARAEPSPPPQSPTPAPAPVPAPQQQASAPDRDVDPVPAAPPPPPPPAPEPAAAEPAASTEPRAAPAPQEEAATPTPETPAPEAPANATAAPETTAVPEPEVQEALEPADTPPAPQAPAPQASVEPPAARPADAEPAIETRTSEPQQQAALPPEPDTAVQQEVLARVLFTDGQDEVAADGNAALNDLAQSLQADESQRIQLLAYAAGDSSQVNQARRLSLSRALAVRQFLIAQGIRSTRMDVRALGNNVPDGPPNRVDIVPAPR